MWARGANISPGYWHDPEATAAKFVDGWLLTGDLATIDDEGFISIVGRSEDFIESWGFRIAPQQVEEAALRHELVTGATAIGVPDPEAGEAIVLAVSLVPGAVLSPDDALAFLRGVLPKHAGTGGGPGPGADPDDRIREGQQERGPHPVGRASPGVGFARDRRGES